MKDVEVNNLRMQLNTHVKEKHKQRWQDAEEPICAHACCRVAFHGNGDKVGHAVFGGSHGRVVVCGVVVRRSAAHIARMTLVAGRSFEALAPNQLLTL